MDAETALEQHLRALATEDAELMSGCVTPDHVNHEAADEPSACSAPGVPGLMATAAWLRLAFSELAFVPLEVVASPGRLIAHSA